MPSTRNTLSLKQLAAALLLLGLCACSDDHMTHSAHYADIKEMEADGVFEKGWLPEKLLPATANAITVKTSVDLVAGEGDFSFQCKDYERFTKKLKAYDGERLALPRQNDRVRDYEWRHGKPLVHATKESHWIFLCMQNDETCSFEFMMRGPKSL